MAPRDGLYHNRTRDIMGSSESYQSTRGSEHTQVIRESIETLEERTEIFQRELLKMTEKMMKYLKKIEENTSVGTGLFSRLANFSDNFSKVAQGWRDLKDFMGGKGAGGGFGSYGLRDCCCGYGGYGGGGRRGGRGRGGRGGRGGGGSIPRPSTSGSGNIPRSSGGRAAGSGVGRAAGGAAAGGARGASAATRAGRAFGSAAGAVGAGLMAINYRGLLRSTSKMATEWAKAARSSFSSVFKGSSGHIDTAAKKVGSSTKAAAQKFVTRTNQSTAGMLGSLSRVYGSALRTVSRVARVVPVISQLLSAIDVVYGAFYAKDLLNKKEVTISQRGHAAASAGIDGFFWGLPSYLTNKFTDFENFPQLMEAYREKTDKLIGDSWLKYLPGASNQQIFEKMVNNLPWSAKKTGVTPQVMMGDATGLGITKPTDISDALFTGVNGSSVAQQYTASVKGDRLIKNLNAPLQSDLQRVQSTISRQTIDLNAEAAFNAKRALYTDKQILDAVKKTAVNTTETGQGQTTTQSNITPSGALPGNGVGMIDPNTAVNRRTGLSRYDQLMNSLAGQGSAATAMWNNSSSNLGRRGFKPMRSSNFEETAGTPNYLLRVQKGGQQSNQKQVSSELIDTMIQSGASPTLAKAIVGNMAVESRHRGIEFNPNAVGDNGTAYGLMQWRGNRLTNLKAFANEHGLNHKDRRTQAMFAVEESKPNSKYRDPGSVKARRLIEEGKLNLNEATDVFMTKAERPNPAFAHLASRQAAARQAAADYKAPIDLNVAALMGERGSTGLVSPVTGTLAKYDSSQLGAGRSGGRRRHSGNDFQAANGSPVVASGDGTVVYAGNHRGYGGTIDVLQKLPDGTEAVFRYATHTDVGDIKVGQKIKAGERIGTVGAGHLHHEVRTKAGWEAAGGKPGAFIPSSNALVGGKSGLLDPTAVYNGQRGQSLTAGMPLTPSERSGIRVATSDFKQSEYVPRNAFVEQLKDLSSPWKKMFGGVKFEKPDKSPSQSLWGDAGGFTNPFGHVAGSDTSKVNEPISTSSMSMAMESQYRNMVTASGVDMSQNAPMATPPLESIPNNADITELLPLLYDRVLS